VIVGGTAGIVDLLGRVGRSLQAGDAQRYMAAFAVGAAALVFLATRPTTPSELKVVVSGNTVTVDASRSGKGSQRGLTYDFDFDNDGHPEISGSKPDARYTYDTAGQHTIKVTVRDPRWHTESSIKSKVDLSDAAQGGAK
jgi:hypothetical protein